MATTAGSLIGQPLSGGRYVVLDKLGEGGMGQVYRARDANLETDVVIKVPLRAMLDDPEFVRRFRDEIRALVELVHPHIVRITDVGAHGRLTFAVMQYLAGGNLDDRIAQGPDGRRVPQPGGSIAGWLGPIAEALDFVHTKGYVHRDVKPANILFDAQGYAYLSDFGVIKAVANAPRAGGGLTGTGMVLGTAEYMAPELIMGDPFDGRVDQYALAITLYEALCGRRPFEAEAATAVLVQQTTKTPPPLLRQRPDLPEALGVAVHRALEKDPSRRFPTCAAFSRAVLHALGVGPAAEGVRVSPAGGKPLKVPCPSCGSRLSAPADAIGRKVRCPACDLRFVLDPDAARPTSADNLPRGGTVLLAAPPPSEIRATRPEVAPVPAPPPSPAKTTAQIAHGPRAEPPKTDLDLPDPPESPGPSEGRGRLLVGAAVLAALAALVVLAFVLRPGPRESGREPAEVAALEAVSPSGPPATAPEPEPTPESDPIAPEPEPEPEPPSYAEDSSGGMGGFPTRFAPPERPTPAPPPEPRLIQDVAIAEVIAAPEAFAGDFVVPEGYFQIGPTVKRLPDGDFTTYLVAQPAAEVCSRGNGPEPGDRLAFVVDAALGDALAGELSSAGRNSAPCIPKFEIRPAPGGGWVAAIVQLTIGRFGSFDSLYAFQDLANKNSLALRDEVDVVLIGPGERFEGSAPASEWESRIGEKAVSNAKVKMRNKLQALRGQNNRMQMNALSRIALQQGLIQGQRNQRQHDNLIRQMFGGR